MTEPELATTVRAATTALLVVDMQNDFCHPDGYYASIGRDISTLNAAVTGVQRMIALAREHDVTVVFTELVYDDRHGSIEERHRIKPRRWSSSGRRLVPGSWGAEIVEECRPHPDDIVIQKHGYSAFEGTHLEKALNERGITTLLVCGVVTYACVLASAFSAFDKGFDVCLVSDAVGSWSEVLGSSTAEIVDLLVGRTIAISDVTFAASDAEAMHQTTSDNLKG